jgi:hypothetical protein
VLQTLEKESNAPVVSYLLCFWCFFFLLCSLCVPCFSLLPLDVGFSCG